MAGIEKDDLRDLRDTILEEMRAGFSGVHQRQDITNGRVGKAEVALAEHSVRLTNMEREVFPRRRPPSSPTSETTAERLPITRREVYLVLAAVAGTLSTIGVAYKALPVLALLIKAVTP